MLEIKCEKYVLADYFAKHAEPEEFFRQELIRYSGMVVNKIGMEDLFGRSV